jgi:hypothetical protein
MDAIDEESVLLHCGQVRAARDERDVRAGAGEHAAEIGTDRPRTHDRNFAKSFLILCHVVFHPVRLSEMIP